MRRRSERPLPPWSEIEAARRIEGAGEQPLRLLLPLRTITPVVGGGWERMEPDPVEAVRLPEVRGLLRWWWRALFHDPSENPEALFAREAKLWGGVDVPDAKSGKKEARPSRVLLDVRVRGEGKVKPAGEHRLNDRGLPKAAANWNEKALGYALFPLQRNEEERQEHLRKGRREPLATRSIRTGLRFDLKVSIDAVQDADEVLLALWAWIRFGGLGARTRRGFGALELDDDENVQLSPGPVGVSIDFDSTDPFGDWHRLRRESSARLGDGARLLLGAEVEGASRAHGRAIELLKTFRQIGDGALLDGARRQVPVGRRSGHGGKPGHSNWPEADRLRRERGVPPRDRDLPEGDSVGDCGAPRAAFGMPLLIKFRFQDRADQVANATLVPTAGGRWSSPLILRPIACGGGKYRPMALLLGGARPAEAKIEWDRPPRGGAAADRLPIRSAAGARTPIRQLLDAHGGDALYAFADWLTTKHGFVDAAGPRGGRR